MSVLTKLLLLATYLFMLADGVPNKKNKRDFQYLSNLRPRDISSNPNKDDCYPSGGSSRAPLSSSLAMGSGSSSMPSGTGNIGSSSGSTGVIPYPTEGAPYQNYTSLQTKQGKSGSGSQFSPQQIITLPPQTINLPAQTVTMTPAPETITITITPQAQTETVTVTVTPQTLTTTTTVWMTVTVNQAHSCPSTSNAANALIAPVSAPNPQPFNMPTAPVLKDTSTPVIVPPAMTTPNVMVSLSTGNAVPIAKANSPVIPILGPSTATGPILSPEISQTSPVFQQASSSFVSPRISSTPFIAPFPFRNATNQTLPIGSGSSRGFRPTGSGLAKSTNRHISSSFVYKFVTDTPVSTTTIGPSPATEYFPRNGSVLLTSPSRANATIFQPSAGPTTLPSPTREYFPDDGSSLLTPPTLANATAPPTEEYFPDDGSSLLTPPSQANATSVSPVGGPTAPTITPAVVGPSQTLAVVVGSLPPPPTTQSKNATSIPQVSTPIPPSPPIIQSNTSNPQPTSTPISQTPQAPTTSTPPLCTNGTTAQNITTNFSELPPIRSTPLILQGLNYTTFAPTTAPTNSTSPLPPPTLLLAPPASTPKQIALAPNSLSFSLTSLSLSCGNAAAAGCTVQMFGVGAGAAGDGAEEGTERSVAVGPGMQSVVMGASWVGLREVAFTAEAGGVGVGVVLGEVVYEIVRAC